MRARAITRDRAPIRATAQLILLVIALVGLLSGGPAAAATSPGQQVRLEGPVADGVVLRERVDAGPVTSVEVTIHPGAPVRFVPVLSGQRVDGGREVVSSMCHRAGGAVCVNANFPVCASCGHPFGGIVRDGELIRTPTPQQDQVSVVDGRLTLEPWPWSVGLLALGATHHPSVEADGVNVAPIPDGIVAYTPTYGTSTDAPPGSYEVVVRAPRGLRTGVGNRSQAELLRVHTAGHAPIPWDGLVLSGHGRGADALWAFVQTNRSALIELVSNTPDGLTQSFAGHPVLLRDGQRQWMDPADNKVMARHPRTLIGWNDHGSVWIVLVDGRQRHSRGMTLAEATDRMIELGATNAVNLDGGGSSTMVTTCPSATGWCLRNRPSDGRQRNVWVALALVPTAPRPAPAAAVEQPPAPTTTVAPTTTTTRVPPTTAAPTTTQAPAAAPSSLGTGESDHVPSSAHDRRGHQAPRSPRIVTAADPASSELASLAPAARDVSSIRDRPGVVAVALGIVLVELALLTHLVRRRRGVR